MEQNHIILTYDDLVKIYGHPENSKCPGVFSTIRITDIVKDLGLKPTDGSLLNKDYRIGLPAHMTILGDLDLRGALTSVPDYCTVKGDVYLYQYEPPVGVKELNVSGRIYLVDSPELKLSGGENNFRAKFLDIEPANIDIKQYFSIGPDRAFPGVGIMNVHYDVDEFRAPTIEYLKNAYYGPDSDKKSKRNSRR